MGSLYKDKRKLEHRQSKLFVTRHFALLWILICGIHYENRLH